MWTKGVEFLSSSAFEKVKDFQEKLLWVEKELQSAERGKKTTKRVR